MPDTPQRPKAAEAFAKAHPDVVAQFAERSEKARPALLAFGRVVSVLGEAQRQIAQQIAEIIAAGTRKANAQFAALWEQIREEMKREEKEWERTYGVPYPKSIEDIERLAVRAGLDANYVRAGHYKLDDVFPIIEGYLLRLADQHQQANAHTAKKRKRKENDVSKVAQAIGLLVTRANDKGRKLTMREIAKTVQCSQQNLYDSKRFMNAYDAYQKGDMRSLRKVHGTEPADWTTEPGQTGGGRRARAQSERLKKSD